MVIEDIKHEVKKLHIGKKIRDIRKKAGLVLQDLSNRTGLSKSLLGREESGYYYEALAYKKSKKYMEPFLVEFKKKKPEKLSYFSHEGEEFIYLLEGTLEFRTESEQYVLCPGDSLYFESSISHAYRAMGRRNAKALTVVYPAR
jgi:quercetin dioxygenase-like cupin family protein